MRINKKIIPIQGIKLFIKKDGEEIARAFLYILKNDIRGKKFGYLEDVFVDENFRDQGIGTKLLKKVIIEAKKNNCYKIVATSRKGKKKVHAFYEKMGFKNFGIEFKMYLEN